MAAEFWGAWGTGGEHVERRSAAAREQEDWRECTEVASGLHRCGWWPSRYRLAWIEWN
jgi:hypothetical protein